MSILQMRFCDFDLIRPRDNAFWPGFATKAFHSKAKLKRLNILGSYVRLSFWDSEILKVLRLSALTGLIRVVLLRLSSISKAEMGSRQI